MSNIEIANQSDKWMYDLEKKADKIGLNRREQKQYIKLEEIRDKYYEIHELNFYKKYKNKKCNRISYFPSIKFCVDRDNFIF